MFHQHPPPTPASAAIAVAVLFVVSVAFHVFRCVRGGRRLRPRRSSCSDVHYGDGGVDSSGGGRVFSGVHSLSSSSTKSSLVSVTPSPTPPTGPIDLTCGVAMSKDDDKREEHRKILRLAKSQSSEDHTALLDSLAPDVCAKTFGPDRSTIFHVAAEVGNLELTKRLIRECPNQLEVRDRCGDTPLSVAVAHSRPAVVKALLAAGSNIASQDDIGNSVLMIGAVARCYGVLKMVLNHADVAVLPELVNHQNNFGCTSLHFAAAEGSPEMLQLLLDSGADGWSKKLDGHTPLHWAAWNGRLDIVKRLVDREKSLMEVVNDAGDTPFHTAAFYDQVGVVGFFLAQKCYVLDSRATCKLLPVNKKGFTPLDLAVEQGNVKSCQLLVSKMEQRAKIRFWDDFPFPTKALFLACESGHDHIVEILLSTVKMRKDKEIFKERDAQGRNCLVLALENNHRDVVEIIVKDDEWQSAMYTSDRCSCSPMRQLITKFPELALLVFGKCCQESKRPRNDIDYSVVFNYELIEDAFVDLDAIGGMDCPNRPKKPRGWLDKKRDPLMLIVDLDRDELLQHPLVTTLLDRKWSFLRNLYLLNLAAGFAYALVTTLLVAFVKPIYNYSCLRPFYATNFSTCSDLCPRFVANGSCHAEFMEAWPEAVSVELLQWATFTFAFLHLFIELAQLLTRGSKYFELKNLFDVLVPLLSVLFVINIGVCSDIRLMCPWQWQLGTVCLLSSWIKVTMKLRDFSYVGVFVSMFVHVLKTFSKIIIILVPFFVSFAFTFHAMLRGNEFVRAFDEPIDAVMKTIVMTLGELDYGNLFNALKQQQLSDKVLTITYFLSFLVVMPIIIMNLLLGLAVGDIGAIMEIAEIKKLRARVNSLLGFQYNLPIWLQEWLYFKLWNIDCDDCEGGVLGGHYELKPNRTFENELRLRMGLSIQSGAARKLSAKLNAVAGGAERITQNEKEVQIIATQEQINQVHESVAVMQKKLNMVMCAVGVDEKEHRECSRGHF